MTKQHKQTAPRLRFQGFDGAWEEKTLGDFVKSLDAGVSVNSEDILPEIDGFSILKTSCLSSGAFDENERKRVISQAEISRLKEELKSNSILMSRMNTPNLVGLSAYIEKAPKNTFLPDRLWQLKVDGEQANTEWLACYLGKPENLSKIQDNATGTSGSMKNITKSDVLQFEILAPQLSEQTRLGNFFRELDYHIAQSRALCEKSRQLKQAMLAKMLPTAGETAPKIRFKGFTGEWERKTLGEVVEVERKGKAQFQQLQAGNVPYLDAEFLNGGEKFLTDAIQDVNADDVLIIWDGSNAGKVYIGFNGVLGSTLKMYRTNSDCSPMFLYQELVRNEEIIFSQYRTPNIPHVIKDFSSEYHFLMPSYEEQTAIGNFFRQLDDTIALHALETETLGRLKKALLAAMLV